MLMYAEAGGVDSMTFPVINTPLLSFRYRQCTHARFPTPTGPPAYNGCAEGCTMANKHTGSVWFLLLLFFFLNQHFNLLKCKTEKPPRASRPSLRTNYPKKKKGGESGRVGCTTLFLLQTRCFPARPPGFVVSNHFKASWSPLIHPRMSSGSRAVFHHQACALTRSKCGSVEPLGE